MRMQPPPRYKGKSCRRDSGDTASSSRPVVNCCDSDFLSAASRPGALLRPGRRQDRWTIPRDTGTHGEGQGQARRPTVQGLRGNTARLRGQR